MAAIYLSLPAYYKSEIMISLFIYLFILFTTHTHTHVNTSGIRHVLAAENMSLEDRYPVKSVNLVFKDNILLTLAYMRGDKIDNNINWSNIEKPFHYEIKLPKSSVFAFQSDVLPEYTGKIIATTNARFNYQEGFKSDGYLYGDGVCHLASLINFTAQKAGLISVAPTPHNFAIIPDIPQKYGAAIYSSPLNYDENARQNLYVENNTNHNISLAFDYNNNTVKVSVIELD